MNHNGANICHFLSIINRNPVLSGYFYLGNCHGQHINGFRLYCVRELKYLKRRRIKIPHFPQSHQTASRQP